MFLVALYIQPKEEKKMIQIKCTAQDTVRLHDLTPFQGDLKKRTPKDIDALISSLMSEGLLMPFAIWQNDDKNFLLDGHGRLEALIRASLVDPKIIEQDFPCLKITAASEEDARKALLQITSSYGNVTKKGIVDFTASIADYHAPIVDKALKRHRHNKTLKSPKVDALVKIRVPFDKEAEVRHILSQIEYITVL